MFVLCDSKTGKEYPIPPTGLRVGRGAQNDLVLSDEHVSYSHATFWVQEGHLYVRDESSTNGTWVNNQRISAATWVAPLSQVQIGQTLFQVVLAAPIHAQMKTAGTPSARAGLPKWVWAVAGIGLGVLLLALVLALKGDGQKPLIGVSTPSITPALAHAQPSPSLTLPSSTSTLLPSASPTPTPILPPAASPTLTPTSTPMPPQATHVLYFYFGAQGCPYSRRMAPKVERLYQEYGVFAASSGGRQVVLAALALPPIQEPQYSIEVQGVAVPGWGSDTSGFVQATGITFRVGPDPGLAVNTSRIPVTVVYNKQTQVFRIATIGDVPYSTLESKVTSAVKGGDIQPSIGSS